MSIFLFFFFKESLDCYVKEVGKYGFSLDKRRC